jgi:hypothetical protein
LNFRVRMGNFDPSGITNEVLQELQAVVANR